MGAQFASASSQYLSLATSPIGATYPITVACWFKADAAVGATSETIWSINGAADGNKGYRSTSNAISMYDGTNVSSLGTTMTAGAWYFGVWRFISTTNKRMGILNADGSAGHTQITATGVVYSTSISIGAGATPSFTQGWNGTIAEFWYTSTDIQADGAQLQDALLRRLAYGGPFSIPHIFKDVIEYRSMWSSLASDSDRWDEIYSGVGGRRAWVNNGAVRVGPHPPLPYWYEKPKNFVRKAMI